MTAEPPALEALISRSWTAFRRSPAVMAPLALAFLALLAGWIGGLAAVAVWMRRTGDNGALAIVVAAWVATAVVATAAAWVATFGIADAAWRDGAGRLGEARTQLGGRTAGMILTMVALFFCGIVAVVLAIPTFFLALPVYGILTMYALPITALGGPSGFAAIAASARLARATFRRSAVVWALLALLRFLPLLPVYALSFAVQGIAIAVIRSHGAPRADVSSWLAGLSAAVVLALVVGVAATYGFWTIALTGWYRSLAGEDEWRSSASA